MLFESESLVTSVRVIGFHSNLVGDMCTMCAIYSVKMSSIGGGQKIHVFGGEHKNKCNLGEW